jgi:hypothetical protein
VNEPSTTISGDAGECSPKYSADEIRRATSELPSGKRRMARLLLRLG